MPAPYELLEVRGYQCEAIEETYDRQHASD
jgi:hypothetical protein